MKTTILKNKIEELRNEWLNQEITLWDLDGITGTDMSGKYDLKRDLMSSENEGSYDAEEVNFEFKFIDGEEIEFNGKVVITDIYAL